MAAEWRKRLKKPPNFCFSTALDSSGSGSTTGAGSTSGEADAGRLILPADCRAVSSPAVASGCGSGLFSGSGGVTSGAVDFGEGVLIASGSVGVGLGVKVGTGVGVGLGVSSGVGATVGILAV